MDRHPEFDRLFSQAMDSVEALAGDSFARDFDWGRFDRVFDVGCGMVLEEVVCLRSFAKILVLQPRP